MSEARWAAIPSDAIDDPELTLTDFRVLGVIGYHSDRQRGAWPKQQTIADRLGCSREAVNRSVNRLKAKGYIKVAAQHRTDGGQRENRYFVLLDPVEGTQRAVPVDSLDPQPAPPPVIARSHPPVIPEITPPVIAAITPNKDEHTNKNTPPTPEGVGGERGKDETFSPEQIGAYFGELWTAWPVRGQKRSAGGKVCLDAFKAACHDTHPARIVKAARAFAATNNPAYTPGLQKWLNDRQFEHFLETENSVTHSAAPAATRPPAPINGRAGACYRAIVERYGAAKAAAWLGDGEWHEADITLPSEFHRARVENEFGGFFRTFNVEIRTTAGE